MLASRTLKYIYYFPNRYVQCNFKFWSGIFQVLAFILQPFIFRLPFSAFRIRLSAFRIRFSALSILLLAFGTLSAQLSASFTTNKFGGCSPVEIKFNNTTTGASANAVYRWEFGNGNTSALLNPSATYDTVKDYTITLTVTDGNQQSKATRTITVYKNPTVDFSVDKTKLCIPDEAVFQSKSDPGSGTFERFTWDYGDGMVDTRFNESSNYFYSYPLLATVTLTVSNSFGCFSTLQKKDMIRVLPEILIEWAADKRFVCKSNDKVTFSNESTGPGTLSYLWNFGDGTTSTQKNPEHVFNKSGAFNVTLTIISNEGCSKTSSPVLINVENFVSDFSQPTLMCTEDYHTLINTSKPRPTKTLWTIENLGEHQRWNGEAMSLYYLTPGPVKVKIENEFGTCIQTFERTIIIVPKPYMGNFIAEQVGKCGAPDTIRLRDTSTTAVKWNWTTNFRENTISTQKQFNYPVTENRVYYFNLTTTNAEGCTRNFYNSVIITRPSATISMVESTGNGVNQSCGPFTAKFQAGGTDSITQYNWVFSNGGISTEASPTQGFKTPGQHTVSLAYKLANGCQGTTSYIVTVWTMPQADFTHATSRDVCGPLPAQVLNTTIGNTTAVFWNYDYGNNRNGYTPAGNWSYKKDTVYTVSMIAVNGTCRDTIVKKDFFNVLPPFPRITSVLNTCDGTRGEVLFAHETIKGISGTWNFGDGNNAPFNPARKEIKHTYTATGTYTVTLAVTNGSCTISDSKPVFVLLKQKPILATDRADVCANESFGFNLTNIETNPYQTQGWDRYYFKKWEYGDGSTFKGYYDKPWNFSWINNVNGTAVSSDNQSNNIRIIFTSAFFNCDDTSSFVALSFKGARAGYEIVTDKRCWQLPVVFRDTSKVFGTSAITSRRWNFGDGQTLTTTVGGLVSHQYTNPGTYRVTLEITDAGGCRVSTTSTTDVIVSGPKAAFNMSGYQVPLNETIYFYNYTNTTNSNNMQSEWSFGDGTTGTDYHPYHTYPVAGTYRIRLVARNPQTGCSDTAFQTLVVRPFNTNFQMQQRFVESGGCPPVLVNFNNTSYGGVRYEWDFGDGTGSESYYATKLYHLPGKYIVKLKVYGYNGLEGEYLDSVFISIPQASFKADPLFGCTSQGIQFKGIGTDVKNYLWDYGDGTTTSIPANRAFHSYRTPGVYQPRLFAVDSNGCTIPVNTPDKIVIDSLFIAFKNLPQSICDSAKLNLVPDVVSVGGNVDPASYVYQWRITHGRQTTTMNTRNIEFTFNKPGKYTLDYNVKSPYGCDKTITDSIFVVQGVKAIINAPTDACIGTAVTFAGSTSQPVNGTSWKWDLGNVNTSMLQNPPVQLYNQTGNYNISLIAGIGNCYDTAQQALTIHPNPVLAISNRAPLSCLGNGIQLDVTGAATYQWTPAAGLNNTTLYNPLANPANNTLYRVSGKSAQGCISNDSVEVKVAKPFNITVTQTSAEICSGATVNLSANGASQYQWINSTAGLSNTAIANPNATPAASVVYTVVGRDNVNCFTDTVQVSITVNPLPVVNAGPDQQVNAGSEITLQTTASANVVNYAWSPATLLSCTNCAQPVVKPLYPVSYTVTVTSDKGCTATDNVQVTLECGKSFFIPNGFTPNGDGLNDRFYVLGGGGTVKSFRIFNRWGKLIFERKEVAVNDSNAGWDGNSENKPQPTGSYVYHAVLTCFDGSLYEYKGTITLVR